MSPFCVRICEPLSTAGSQSMSGSIFGSLVGCVECSVLARTPAEAGMRGNFYFHDGDAAFLLDVTCATAGLIVLFPGQEPATCVAQISQNGPTQRCAGWHHRSVGGSGGYLEAGRADRRGEWRRMRNCPLLVAASAVRDPTVQECIVSASSVCVSLLLDAVAGRDEDPSGVNSCSLLFVWLY